MAKDRNSRCVCWDFLAFAILIIYLYYLVFIWKMVLDESLSDCIETIGLYLETRRFWFSMLNVYEMSITISSTLLLLCIMEPHVSIIFRKVFWVLWFLQKPVWYFEGLSFMNKLISVKINFSNIFEKLERVPIHF